jgi:hypothetical protein
MVQHPWIIYTNLKDKTRIKRFTGIPGSLTQISKIKLALMVQRFTGIPGSFTQISKLALIVQRLLASQNHLHKSQR